jgi:hypothetical protein
MSVANNPLRQYFRRPAIYIKLPSGGHQYPADVVVMTENGELPVYPMTAIDEITTKTPDALFNGNAIVDIISSCIPAIKDPWRISGVDLDAVLIAIKSASAGSEMEIETECPSCKETSTYGVNLVGLLSTLKASDYSRELVLNELTFKFKSLTYKEINQAGLGQFELQRRFALIDSITDPVEKHTASKEAFMAITEITMNILAGTIEYIKTPMAYVDSSEFITDFLKNCDKSTYEQIKDYSTSLKSQSEIKPLKVKCIACAYEYEQPFSLNASDFFG